LPSSVNGSPHRHRSSLPVSRRADRRLPRHRSLLGLPEASSRYVRRFFRGRGSLTTMGSGATPCRPDSGTAGVASGGCADRPAGMREDCRMAPSTEGHGGAGPQSGPPDAVLPRYGLAGWPETAGNTLWSWFGGGDTEDLRPAEIRVYYSDGDRHTIVASNREGAMPVEQVRGLALRHLSMRPPARRPDRNRGERPVRFEGVVRIDRDVQRASWDCTVILPVEGIPTRFEAARIDIGWAAVGHGPESIISVVALHVPETDIAIVRLPDMPSGLPPLRPPRKPRDRRFPDEYLYGAPPPPGEVNVYLSYDGRRLTGVVDWLAVDVAWDRWHGASGVFAGTDVSAAWSSRNRSPEPGEDPAAGLTVIDQTLRGRFGDQVVSLTGEFHLDDAHTIDRAWIRGEVDGQPIQATVEALDGGLDGGQGGTVAVEGSFAGTPFALVATISMNLRDGMVRGTINNIAVRIDAYRPPGSAPRDPGRLHLTGTYPGPPAFLAIIVGALLRFDLAARRQRWRGR
jgi:hypothetical protein